MHAQSWALTAMLAFEATPVHVVGRRMEAPSSGTSGRTAAAPTSTQTVAVERFWK